MKKQIIEEIRDMKYLLNYNRGRILSEQPEVDDVELEDYEEELDEEMDFSFDEMDEQREVETPVRPGIKTPTKPSKPSTPYRPKPGPKKAPKAEKADLPDWLTFDELGIDFE